MQLNSGVCELCKTLLIPRAVKKFTRVAGFHQSKVLLAKTHIAVKENLSDITSKNISHPEKQRKRELRISCKRPEFNQYVGQSYDKFDTIRLASQGWCHRKSRGDYFTILGYRENPAIINPTEPIKSFSDLGIIPNIITNLEKQNITSPTVIQVEGIPAILKGQNVILTAETGCGKTLAYLLPMLQQILTWKFMLNEREFNRPLGLVVSPNRELANQIGEVAMEFGREMRINTNILTGGHTKRKMLNPEFEEVDLLIASFGALSKLTTTGIISMRDVRHVVLDEADTLLDDSFNEKLCHFLRRFSFVRTDSPTISHTQLTLVSATMPTSVSEILGGVIEPDSLVRVATSHVHRLMPHVPQKFYRLSINQKPAQLLTMVKNNIAKKEPTIIFSNKASTCDWISLFLNENAVPCVNLNGKMLLDMRTGKLQEFQSGAVDVISCTDIGSRGVNTTRVKHVINYDFPLYTADYIHRCGRTGRVGSSQGCYVSNFVCTEREVYVVQKIEMAARKMEALPNVNGNISRTIKYRIMKNLEKQAKI